MGTAMRHSLRLAGLLLGATLMAGVAGQAAATMQEVAQLPAPEGGFEHCRTITNDAERLRCYEAATAKRSDPAGANVAGTWRLVRTPNPATGESAISIMQTADISRSDLDLAGLMVRCAEATTEVLVVLVRPLPPRAQPKVTVAAAGHTVELTASVVAPGLMLLLPPQANALAAGAWQAAPDLTITVADESAPIRGVIPLGGLGTALRELRANCLAR
jgi:hypothetical protein